jgi:ATP-dependent DNA helicase RecG
MPWPRKWPPLPIPMVGRSIDRGGCLFTATVHRKVVASVVEPAGSMTNSGKTPDVILSLLKESPTLSIPELAEETEKFVSAIERAVRKLRQSSRLKRIGPAKGGHWKVVKTDGK